MCFEAARASVRGQLLEVNETKMGEEKVYSMRCQTHDKKSRGHELYVAETRYDTPFRDRSRQRIMECDGPTALVRSVRRHERHQGGLTSEVDGSHRTKPEGCSRYVFGGA